MNIQISVAYDAQTYDGIAIVHVIRMALNQVEVHPVALFQIFAGLSLADAKTTLVTTLIDKQVGIIARGVAVQLLQLLDGGQDNLLCFLILTPYIQKTCQTLDDGCIYLHILTGIRQQRPSLPKLNCEVYFCS